jgi:hypothetical protein
MNVVLGRMWKEDDMASFNELPQYLPEETKVKHVRIAGL